MARRWLVVLKPEMVGWGLAALAALVLGASPAVANPGHYVRHVPKHAFGRDASTNWSGYSVDGSNASYVTGSWTQPNALDCSTVPNSWSSPWVGIDGDISNTVEQIGTDSDCSSGVPTYYGWYEMYPKRLVLISTMTVSPGHSYTATVTYSSPAGGFVMTLTDNTTKASYTTPTVRSNGAKRTSVEWIMEGPSAANLTDFGTIGFSAASGTINGTSGFLDPAVFPSANPITMVTRQNVPRAVPSSPPRRGSFSVSWQHS